MVPSAPAPNNTLRHALDLAERGKPVFPCKPDKSPLTAAGFKDATTDPEQIEAWWTEYPAALIGVPTGSASGWVVLDADPAGAQWYAEHLPELRAGRIHTTQRGQHVLYECPDPPPRCSAGKIAPGIDVRGEGGYFIWWPAAGLPTVGDLDDIGPPPAWLRDRMSEPTTASAPARLACIPEIDARTINDLRSALLHLPADDYDLWIAMGLALATIGDDGRGMWLEWSRQFEGFDPREAARKWESFKPTGTDYRAVFAEAQRQGWINPNSNAARGNRSENSNRSRSKGDEYENGAEDRSKNSDRSRSNWPEPQNLTARFLPEPYPLDALPATIRGAVEEVAEFVKAPLPLVASSALAALSVATQALVNAKRTDKLEGPASLFLLTIADSGERKSTCDGFFLAPIREYQEREAAARQPDLDRYAAALGAWNSEREGLLAAIKEASKKGKPTGELRAQLERLQTEQPQPPRIPRLLLGDETPEALAWSLARRWPSAGVISSEAGLVLGSHGMGTDSVMRNLGLLNILWDGGTHSVGRRTSESFTVKGARLTVALQVQEATLRSFFQKSGNLARGTGFLARFLIACPESTQGTRFFTEAPASWPRLSTFGQRIEEILSHPVELTEAGGLDPQPLEMDQHAKRLWIEFHDEIEKMLPQGGELYDVRDVASKTADNAARLAVLFQVFEHGTARLVSAESFEAASRIVAWHLNEARRFFGELALPAEMADAARLDAWLLDYCKREGKESVSKNHARQYGPVREGLRLDAAITELLQLDRLAITKEGKRRNLHPNPALLEGTP